MEKTSLTQNNLDRQGDVLDPTLQTVLDKLEQIEIKDERQGDVSDPTLQTILGNHDKSALLNHPAGAPQDSDEESKPAALSHFKRSSPLSSPLSHKLRFSLHKDSNLETPLQPKPLKPRHQTHPAAPPAFFTLMFDASTSSARNPVAEKIFQREKAKYNESSFYRLIKHEGSEVYHLQSNHNATPTIPNGTYAYVIMRKKDGSLELRLGNKNHFYVSDKSYHEVVAAGDIKFTKVAPDSACIDWITDFSGGYHLQEKDLELLAAKRESIKLAIITVGLPLEKFHFFTAEELAKKGRYSP